MMCTIAFMHSLTVGLHGQRTEQAPVLRDLEEELRKANLAVEHNRHLADEEQLRGALRYRDGVIHGLKYAIRCNGVSGGEVDQ